MTEMNPLPTEEVPAEKNNPILAIGLFIARQFKQPGIQVRLTALILLITIPLLAGITIYISQRAGTEIEKQANHGLYEDNHYLTSEVSTWLELHARTLQEMTMLPDIVSMDASRQSPTLKAIALSHPNLFLVQTTDLTGMNIARNDDTELKDYNDRGWFQGAKSGAPITFEVLISRTTGNPALNMAAPIYNKSGQLVGVASIVSELDEISKETIQKTEANPSISYIIAENNRVVAHPDPAFTADELRDLSTYPPVIALREGKTGLITFVDENGEVWRAYVSALDNNWGIITQQPEATLLEPVKQFQRVASILIAIGVVVMFSLAWFTIRRSLQPISVLTETASAIKTGDLNRLADVKSQDEIGVLASTFNSMTTQLRESIETLEKRVAERTHNLELAAEVGRSVSQVRALDVMLQDACELIREEFDLYYVQAYLANSNQTELVLEAGTGAVGTELLSRGHRLPLNTGSINGRAAMEKRSVVISDTASSITFRSNPLLPDTRGEMAVPLLVADKVVGVLDMQSRNPGTLTDEVLPAFEALAGQLAVAIQNANLLKETQQARAEVEAQARRLVRGGWKQHLDAIHKPEQIGFVFDRKEVLPLKETGTTVLQEDERVISAPIAITGEELGSLVVEIEDDVRKEQTGELVSIVARQVAQQIENLRLLESAERYRYEAEQATRRQTIQGWQEYVKSRSVDTLGYLYDLNAVQPYSNGHEDASALTLPLKVHGEAIGKLAVQGLNSEDGESLELVNAIAERLSAHIESLRLFEETKRGQIELDKRAKQLAAVARVSTASSQELDVQKMLATVVHLTQRQFGLYHAHVFIYNETTDSLKIIACGWKEGDENEGTHGIATIPLTQDQSLVARAARTRSAVLVNDVHNEPSWLPNPLLPDTKAEMAVPLLIGDTLLGVLDVQSDRLNAFTQDDVNIQLTLASQVAIALQNAYSFAQAQKQAEREAMLNAINQKIQSATSVDAVLQIAARELGHALGAPMTIAQLSMKNEN